MAEWELDIDDLLGDLNSSLAELEQMTGPAEPTPAASLPPPPKPTIAPSPLSKTSVLPPPPVVQVSSPDYEDYDNFDSDPFGNENGLRSQAAHSFSFPAPPSGSNVRVEKMTLNDEEDEEVTPRSARQPSFSRKSRGISQFIQIENATIDDFPDLDGLLSALNGIGVGDETGPRGARPKSMAAGYSETENSALQALSTMTDEIYAMDPREIERKKQEKVNEALEKLQKANIQKVVAKIHYGINDGNVKSIQITSVMDCETVLPEFIERANLPQAEDWTFFEVVNDFGIERPMMNHEIPIEVMRTWDGETTNVFSVRRFPNRDWVKLDESSGTFPKLSSWGHVEFKPGKWTRRFIELKYSGIYHSKDTKGTQETLLCKWENVRLYSLSEARRKAPSKYCFCLREQAKPSSFAEDSMAVHFICVDDAESFAKWAQAMRLSYSQKVLELRPDLRTKRAKKETEKDFIKKLLTAPKTMDKVAKKEVINNDDEEPQSPQQSEAPARPMPQPPKASSPMSPRNESNGYPTQSVSNLPPPPSSAGFANRSLPAAPVSPSYAPPPQISPMPSPRPPQASLPPMGPPPSRGMPPPPISPRPVTPEARSHTPEPEPAIPTAVATPSIRPSMMPPPPMAARPPPAGVRPSMPPPIRPPTSGPPARPPAIAAPAPAPAGLPSRPPAAGPPPSRPPVAGPTPSRPPVAGAPPTRPPPAAGPPQLRPAVTAPPQARPPASSPFKSSGPASAFAPPPTNLPPPPAASSLPPPPSPSNLPPPPVGLSFSLNGLPAPPPAPSQGGGPVGGGVRPRPAAAPKPSALSANGPKSPAAAGQPGRCRTCGCEDFQKNQFKPGCNSCFHNH